MKRDIALIVILVCLPIHTAVSDDLTVLPESIDGVPRVSILHQYHSEVTLLHEVENRHLIQ